jgi:hypothetical protein
MGLAQAGHRHRQRPSHGRRTTIGGEHARNGWFGAARWTVMLAWRHLPAGFHQDRRRSTYSQKEGRSELFERR